MTWVESFLIKTHTGSSYVSFVQNVAGLNMFIGSQHLHLTGDSGVTVQHKNELYKSVEKGLTNQMDTNRNTSNKNREWTWPSTCTSHQQKDTKYRSESTRSYWQLVQSQLQLIKSNASETKLSIITHPTSNGTVNNISVKWGCDIPFEIKKKITGRTKLQNQI